MSPEASVRALESLQRLCSHGSFALDRFQIAGCPLAQYVVTCAVCANGRLRKRFGLKATGMFAIVAEFVCLLPCAIAAFFCLGQYVHAT